MSNAVRKAIRTYLQSAIGIFLGLWATSGFAADDFQGISDLTVLGKLGLGALIGAVPALLAYVQNALEDSAGKGLLRPDLAVDEGEPVR